MKTLDLSHDVGALTQRPAWRDAIDRWWDAWLTSSAMYRWSVANPFTRWVTQRRAALRCGVTRMSEPQAEPTRRPGAPSSRVASQARVPCEVR